jgi:sugar lactone lactonase YvrE
VWDPRLRELACVDIDQGIVWLGKTEVAVGPPVSMIALRESGGYIAAVRDGLVSISEDGVKVEPLIEIEADPETRLNDGKCDPVGRLLVGSLSLLTPRAEQACSLYQIEAGRAPVRVINRVSLSNGLGWSPDGATMYFIDTPTLGVDAFDYDLATGSLSRRRRLIDVAGGRPDGMCVDVDGCIWVALWGGSAVHRYTPVGGLDLEVEIPAAQVTSCCFGGDDLRTLFITTAARDVGRREPLAGAVFALTTSTEGVPVGRFAG